MHNPDIAITGYGFYSLIALTPAAREWLGANVPAFGELQPDRAYSDDSGLTQAIADAAIADGLAVTVNAQAYLGGGEVAA